MKAKKINENNRFVFVPPPPPPLPFEFAQRAPPQRLAHDQGVSRRRGISPPQPPVVFPDKQNAKNTNNASNSVVRTFARVPSGFLPVIRFTISFVPHFSIQSPHTICRVIITGIDYTDNINTSYGFSPPSSVRFRTGIIFAVCLLSRTGYPTERSKYIGNSVLFVLTFYPTNSSVQVLRT